MFKQVKLKSSERLMLVLCISIALFFCCKPNYDKDVVENTPIHLSVEYIRQPENILILDLKPEFSWEVPTSVETQSAYQILVASSNALLANNEGDVWDSGKVVTSQSINVEFNGKSLQVGNSYYWKVKLWGENNIETSFSNLQAFKIGKQENIITSANSFQIDEINIRDFKRIGDNSYFIDFGKDAFSNLKFHYETKVNDTLIIHIGEQLLDDKINRKPKGTIRYQEIKVAVNPQRQEYILPIKPDRRNTRPGAIILPDSIPVLMPFRYAEIENFKQDFHKEDFTQLAYHGYWEDDESYFKSSDSILNQVWDLCKYSIKATTFAGVYVDGDRERIPYEADAYLNQLSHYTTDREYAMARQTIEYFMENPTWPTEWQLHVALMFHADYMYTGNTELIEKYYDELKYKTLYELSDEGGLITTENITQELMFKLGFKKGYKKPLADIVDWPSAGWGGDPNNLGERDGYVFKKYNTVVNAFYYQNMRIMTEFATILDKQKDILDFKSRAEKSKKAIQKELFDEKRGVFIDGIGTSHASLHANMLPLAFGLVPEQNIKSVVEFIKSRGMACSVYGAQYLMDALYSAGEAEYALKLMTSRAKRSWYNMIREGSTITMEAWGYKYKNNLDWNHAWGAVPANIIPRGMWGVTPKTPGYSLASIKPQLGNLKTSSIIIPTIRGQIKADYVLLEGQSKKYTIEIPANMKAEFKVNTISSIKLNNVKEPSNGNVLLLDSGKHTIEISN